VAFLQALVENILRAIATLARDSTASVACLRRLRHLVRGAYLEVFRVERHRFPVRRSVADSYRELVLSARITLERKVQDHS
jgi:hypothetical protein